MKIDWFTILAQALNFLILVGLMKHVLYKPILDAIAAQEKKSKDELSSIAAKNSQIQNATAEFQKKNDDFDRQRAELLNKAGIQALLESKKSMEETRKRISDLELKSSEALKEEELKCRQESAQRIQDEIFATVRKVLRSLSGVDMEERITQIFLNKLHEVTDVEKNLLRSNHFILSSSFNLSDQQKSLLVTQLHEAFSNEAAVKFETHPEILGGIELSANGQKLSWSLGNSVNDISKATPHVA